MFKKSWKTNYKREGGGRKQGKGIQEKKTHIGNGYTKQRNANKNQV